ncbi:unnamed protein product [Linum tenue]|uniref:Uncharacterized protein n=1 Tax=Linum tenue TaxID=586396 RepID=A0AAV0PMR9_9ROSI|nr:unnamed protein product [Linum tenue]
MNKGREKWNYRVGYIVQLSLFISFLAQSWMDVLYILVSRKVFMKSFLQSGPLVELVLYVCFALVTFHH